MIFLYNKKEYDTKNGESVKDFFYTLAKKDAAAARALIIDDCHRVNYAAIKNAAGYDLLVERAATEAALWYIDTGNDCEAAIYGVVGAALERTFTDTGFNPDKYQITIMGA